MTTCERCGRAMPENAAICPSCGTISSIARPSATPPTDYGQNPSGAGNFGQPGYGQGYAPQQAYPPQSGYAPPQPGYAPQQGYGYGQPGQQYGQPAMYQSINVNVGPSYNNTPIVVEVLLSLFLGIYGVGWLMAGETTVGVILLICSFVIYWPIMIFGSILTLFIGDLCLFPLAIGAIILNAILLNNALKQRASQITIMQSR